MPLEADELSNIQIIHGDSLEAMKAMPDKAYELAIVDPPYAVGANDGTFGRRNGDGYSKDKKYAPTPIRADLKKYANADEIPNENYFKNLFRVSANQIIWGANYYPQYLNHSGWIVWYKHMTGPLSDAELAYQSFNKVVRVFDFQWSGFVKQRGSFAQNENKTIHPNQKPVALYQWLLKNYAKPGDKILDTHGGSCSIAIACDIMGFDAVIYEIDLDYYKAAVERFERHKQQQVLEFG
jgi:site-specific DNA-methyltransferase (adenine-specific)